jgi:hypothetical protein
VKSIVSLSIGPGVQFKSCGTNAKEATVVPQKSYRLPKQRFLKGVASYIEYFMWLTPAAAAHGRWMAPVMAAYAKSRNDDPDDRDVPF